MSEYKFTFYTTEEKHAESTTWVQILINDLLKYHGYTVTKNKCLEITK